MERNNKFRLRLNLFDGLVLLAALAVAALLLWMNLKPAAPTDTPAAVTQTIRYTVTFSRWAEGSSEMIEVGDILTDNIKNYEMGTVVAVETGPVETLLLDHENRQYVLSDFPGYEDVLVTVESPCTVTDEAVTVGGGYVVRVGDIAYIRGQGYMASGPIVSMEQEGM